MIQSMIFGIVLYLTPSVLLLALLTCREEFDYRREEVIRSPRVESRLAAIDFVKSSASRLPRARGAS